MLSGRTLLYVWNGSLYIWSHLDFSCVLDAVAALCMYGMLAIEVNANQMESVSGKRKIMLTALKIDQKNIPGRCQRGFRGWWILLLKSQQCYNPADRLKSSWRPYLVIAPQTLQLSDHVSTPPLNAPVHPSTVTALYSVSGTPRLQLRLAIYTSHPG